MVPFQVHTFPPSLLWDCHFRQLRISRWPGRVSSLERCRGKRYKVFLLTFLFSSLFPIFMCVCCLLPRGTALNYVCKEEANFLQLV